MLVLRPLVPLVTQLQDFTIREAFLSCMWSIMKVSDPVNRGDEAYTMSFEDFMEVRRVVRAGAMLVSPPCVVVRIRLLRCHRRCGLHSVTSALFVTRSVQCLCRSCDLQSIPTDEDMAALECTTAAQWDAAIDDESRGMRAV